MQFRINSISLYPTMKEKIGNISAISFGLHGKPKDSGPISWLMAKYFDENGSMRGEIDSFFEDNESTRPHLLSHGDVLLASKGYRNFAWTYPYHLGPAIASSIFLVIRPEMKIIEPGYLSIYLNLPSTQAALQSLSAGSSIPSIRRGELEELEIIIPPKSIQFKIIQYAELNDTSIQMHQEIIRKQKSLFHQLVNQVISR